MSKLRFVMLAIMLATIAAASPLPAVVGVARADAPSAGDACAVLHATTRDVNGRMMWCNPTTTGNHSLVWQYGGPS
jgi:hypothetical protein